MSEQTQEEQSPQQKQMEEEGHVPNVSDDAKSGFGEDLNETADQPAEGSVEDRGTDNVNDDDNDDNDTPAQ